jgi:hypothetical protein
VNIVVHKLVRAVTSCYSRYVFKMIPIYIEPLILNEII